MTRRATLTVLSVSLAACLAPPSLGCGGHRAVVLQPEVRHGPGYDTRPRRVLALSASCGSVEFSCPREYVETVDGIVRSRMDFASYTLVEPGQLRLETRDRHETHQTERVQSASSTTVERDRPVFDDSTTVASHSQSERRTSTIVLDGSSFEDLTVPERETVMAEAQADAVLITRIVIGAQHGVWAPDQEVEVMVKLETNGGKTMAWASRCVASSNDFATVTAALEHAARCAAAGGTGG